MVYSLRLNSHMVTPVIRVIREGCDGAPFMVSNSVVLTRQVMNDFVVTVVIMMVMVMMGMVE